MGFFDDLFKPTEQLKESSTIPAWVSKAGQTNYQIAGKIGERPYQAYNAPRIAPFTTDQNAAMAMLRDYVPMGAPGREIPNLSLPRLIDNIPGGPSATGGAGSVQDYMNPYIQQVIDRAADVMRREFDIRGQQIGNQAHMDESFGDARHGVESAENWRNLVRGVGDMTATESRNAFNTAMGLRGDDINRLFDVAGFNRDSGAVELQNLLSYIDSLYRSGGNQQEQTQRSLDLAYGDFLEQRDYPIQQLNMLISALGNTPYSKQSFTAGPSKAASILSTGASVLGSLLGL